MTPRWIVDEGRPTTVPASTHPPTAHPTPAIQRLLIVEDDDALRRNLMAALSRRASSTMACGTVREALEAITGPKPPDLMVLDVSLPDGDAFAILERTSRLAAMPIIIAISGEASAGQSFELAQKGVRAFLPKPFDLVTLERTIDAARTQAPDLVPHLRNAVGHAPVRDVEHVVRRTMVTEALGRTHGSKNGAAKILCVSRQLLQHMVRAVEA